MKTIVALFLACFATALFGQAPPITRGPWTTNVFPKNGRAFTPTFISASFVTTNVGTGGVTTVSCAQFKHTLTFSQATELHPGDEIAFPATAEQYNIAKRTDSTHYETVESIQGARNNVFFEIYTNAAYITDINGLPAAAIGADGSYLIYGFGNGGNSGKLLFVNSINGSNNVRMELNSLPSVYGSGPAVQIYNDSTSVSGGPSWFASLKAPDYCTGVQEDGHFMARWGFSNNAFSSLMGNVGIGKASSSVALDVLGNASFSGTSTSLVDKAKFYSPLAATASRVLFKGADGFATNVTSADPANEYVHADGTVGSPSGSGIPVLNGTGTNTSFSYFTGTTNSPLVVRGTNGVPMIWANTNSDSAGFPQLRFGSNTVNSGYIGYRQTNGNLVLAATNGTPLMELTFANGNTSFPRVGIGNTDPAATLDVNGTIRTRLTPSAVVATDSSTNLASIANGAGMLTNNGSGTIGYMAIPSGGSTQAIVIAAGNGTVTNQVTYLPRLMDGRTNSFQIDLSIGRRWVVTNVTGLSTNVTFQLTNVADGNEYSIEFDGNSLGTNFTVNVTLAAGGATTTNIDWQSPTNGNFTLTATTNQAYKITGEVAATPTATNIVSRWATTDPNPIRGMVATVSAGQSPSNAVVGGLLYKAVALTAATNLNSAIATFSNALQYIVSGNTMTNTGDSITVIYQGTMKPGTNAFKWFVGYETPFSFTCTNGFTAWELRGEITRTASVGAQLQASFTFLQTNGATPFALSGLMTNMFLNYTNGAAVTNVLQLASSQVGSISNNVMKVIFEPSSR